MRAERLQLQHGFGKAWDGENFPERSVRQDHVLAEDTFQIASGEEDRSAAARSADAGFLIIMQRRAGDADKGRTAAESGCGCSVDFTVARADIASRHSNTRLPHTKFRYQ